MAHDRIWLKLDVGLLKDFAVMALRDRCGPAGPLAFVALMVATKTTEWVHGPGTVVFGYATLAAEVGCDRETVRGAVEAMDELGLVRLTEVSDVGFHAEILRWGDHQAPTRPASSTERSRSWRERNQTAADPPTGDDTHSGKARPCESSAGNVGTAGTDERPPNVPGDARVESRELTTATPTSSNDESAGLELVTVESGTARADRGETVRDLFAYWKQRCKHPRALLTTDRRGKIERRLKDGYSPDDIRKGIDGAATSAFVNPEGKRFDDIELICRNGSKLESFIARAGTGVDSPDDFLARLSGRPAA